MGSCLRFPCGNGTTLAVVPLHRSFSFLGSYLSGFLLLSVWGIKPKKAIIAKFSLVMFPYLFEFLYLGFYGYLL